MVWITLVDIFICKLFILSLKLFLKIKWLYKWCRKDSSVVERMRGSCRGQDHFAALTWEFTTICNINSLRLTPVFFPKQQAHTCGPHILPIATLAHLKYVKNRKLKHKKIYQTIYSSHTFIQTSAWNCNERLWSGLWKLTLSFVSSSPRLILFCDPSNFFASLEF